MTVKWSILDTTRLKTGEWMRCFTDFADTILPVNRGALRLVIDEAHLFAPQAGTRGAHAGHAARDSAAPKDISVMVELRGRASVDCSL